MPEKSRPGVSHRSVGGGGSTPLLDTIDNSVKRIIKTVEI